MRLIIEPDYDQVSQWAACYVAARINEAKPTAEHPFVLGCPTGSSPLGMYRHLIKLNKEGVVQECRDVQYGRILRHTPRP